MANSTEGNQPIMNQTGSGQMMNAMPGTAGQAMPGAAPGTAGQAMPGAAPGTAGQTMPGAAPGTAGQAMPGAAPGTAGQAMPGAAPGTAGQVMPGVAPGTAGQVMPGVAPGMAGQVMPGVAPGMAGQVMPGVAPGMAGRMIPGVAAGIGAKKSLGIGAKLGIGLAILGVVAGIVTALFLFAPGKSKGSKSKEPVNAPQTIKTQDADSELDMAIAILPMNRKEKEAMPLVDQTLTNLPQYMRTRQQLDSSDIQNPYKQILLIGDKEHTFWTEGDLLELQYGYLWKQDGSTQSVSRPYGNNDEGFYRDSLYSRTSERRFYTTWVVVEGEYYCANRNGIYRWDEQKQEAEKVASISFSATGNYKTHALRIGRSETTIILAYGEAMDTKNFGVVTYDVKTGTVCSEVTIDASDRNIELYSGFVADSEGRMYFSSCPNAKDSDGVWNIQIVRCDLEGHWETMTNLGTLSGRGDLKRPYAMIQQSGTRIVTNTDLGIVCYEPASDTTTVLVEDGGYYVWKVDAGYLYYRTAPEQKLNVGQYTETAYFDYSGCVTKRMNLDTQSEIQLDMSELNAYSLQYKDTYYSNYNGTVEKDDDGNLDEEFVTRSFEEYFIMYMDRGHSIITREMGDKSEIKKFALLITVDDTGRVQVKDYVE